MTVPGDYLQPDFFRFGWDALFLVKTIQARVCSWEKDLHLLELGAGSGVIACELSQQLPIAHAYLVEAQTEWRSYLENNLHQHGRFADSEIFWGTVGEFNLSGELKADLIVSNPPYYAPARGRPCADERRNTAHRLVLEPWQAWLDCMCRSLAVGGEAWFLQKDPGPLSGKPVLPKGFNLTHEVRSGPMRILCLRHLDVE